MKTLYIVRHAKSSWENPLTPDEKRPLLEKGRKRTGKIIAALHQQGIQLDYLLTSHAERALETARIMAQSLGFSTEDIRVNPGIYKTDGEGLFSELNQIPGKLNSAMIVGHNPALTDFVNHFLDPQIDNLPTSGVVSISFFTDSWEDIATAGYKINFMLFPKIIDQAD